MPPYAGPSAAREDIAGTLRLLLFLGMAIALMIADSRMGWLRTVRAYGEAAVQPLWRLAGLPAKVGQSVRDEAVTRTQLSEENRKLRNALLINRARLTRLQTAAIENARLRGLLGAAEQGGLDVQLAPILDISLDPTRQRLVLDAGADQGVSMGQAVIDAGGLLGQVIDVHRNTSVVLLLTDPDHAVPVAVARNGIRLVAYGRGDRLELANVPMSSDVKVGDVMVTSGMGGRFPPGFPVGTIAKLHPNESRAFLVGELTPAAQLDRGRDVLLLKRVLRPTPVLPPPQVAATTDPSLAPTDTATTTGPATGSLANSATPSGAPPQASATAGAATNASTPAQNATAPVSSSPAAQAAPASTSTAPPPTGTPTP
ncbi:MAG: rod shape-determining protein MreC [Lysobacter sp.]|nr:MAG: rod shape-determining protein MreC [Lysobacter sp.]